MTPLFVVQTSPHFERLFKKLRKQHSELPDLFRQAIEILEIDPYNRTRQHPIKKLTGPQSDGQWRLRLGRFRFRYDITGQTVELKSCNLRREGIYN
jgi:mRNA-degrading endonuclease RelE of RelBE toxin-antitoxin system